MPEMLTISGHEYEIDGAFLIAERYADGDELRIYVTSALSEPTTGTFVSRGPRDGLRSRSLGGGLAQVEEQALRLMDARKHIQIVDAYRQERWA